MLKGKITTDIESRKQRGTHRINGEIGRQKDGHRIEDEGT
jgi:hypothetical protein